MYYVFCKNTKVVKEKEIRNTKINIGICKYMFIAAHVN